MSTRRLSGFDPSLIPAVIDVDVVTWVAAVVTNGGAVSAGRRAIVSNFVTAEKAAGTWTLTDDYWALWGEDTIQALTSLKQRRMGISVSAPSFVPDRGYTFNGTSNYVNTGFIPATHCVAMTGTDQRLASYEVSAVGTTGHCAGTAAGTSSSYILQSRTTSSFMAAALGHAVISTVTSIPTPVGFSAASRADGGTTVNTYKNGVFFEAMTAVAPGNILTPTFPLFIGCRNNAGVPATFSDRAIGLVCSGAPLSAAQEQAQYNNVQAWASALGVPA
jgi:hypothetical protein